MPGEQLLLINPRRRRVKKSHRRRAKNSRRRHAGGFRIRRRRVKNPRSHKRRRHRNPIMRKRYRRRHRNPMSASGIKNAIVPALFGARSGTPGSGDRGLVRDRRGRPVGLRQLRPGSPARDRSRRRPPPSPLLARPHSP